MRTRSTKKVEIGLEIRPVKVSQCFLKGGIPPFFEKEHAHAMSYMYVVPGSAKIYQSLHPVIKKRVRVQSY